MGHGTRRVPPIHLKLLRALAIATMVALPGPVLVQAPESLQVRVTLPGASGPAPVAGHALLVSDEPPSDAPRRVVTEADGGVTIRLRPGRYTVESEDAAPAGGQWYRWTQTIDIVGGRENVLALTIDNAWIDDAPAPSAVAPAPGVATDRLRPALLSQWQHAVAAIWTPRTRVSGVLLSGGLVATSARALGEATPVAVQLPAGVKVAARLVGTDAAREVAVLRIDPSVLAAAPPVAFACGLPVPPRLADGQEVIAIGVPLRGATTMMEATTSRGPAGVVADFYLEGGSPGGPVFSSAGDVVGLTTMTGDEEARAGRGAEARIIEVDKVCDALAQAGKTPGEPAPDGTRLPVEPEPVVDVADPPAEAADRALASLTAYQVSSPDFDVTFITPPMLSSAARFAADRRTGGALSPEVAWERERLLTDFGDWSDYVAGRRPVLLVRVTPRLVEGFWMKVARGAARTQGVSLPPIKRRKPGFARLRVSCGRADVTPIQPFVLDARDSRNDALAEGLYVFAPDAIGPHCGTVTLALSSERAPDRPETKVVDPKVVEQIWNDFASPRRQPVPGPAPAPRSPGP